MPAPVFANLSRTCMSVFRERDPATYTPASGAPKTIPVVFNEAFQVRGIGEDGVRFEARVPVAQVLVSDVAQPSTKDRITIGAKTWKVDSYEADGAGMWMLFLQR